MKRNIGDTNMKEYFAHCHDGSIGTQLESFDYTHALQWNRYNDPDESYYNMYCTYTNLADNDNYARPYLQLSYSAFDDDNGTSTYVSLSANGWFDAFQQVRSLKAKHGMRKEMQPIKNCAKPGLKHCPCC